MILPALIGTIAAKRTTPPAPLSLQLKLDFSSDWQDDSATDSNTIYNGMPRSYDVRALGTGTESIAVSTNGNFSFFAYFSGSETTISGGSSLVLVVSYSDSFSMPGTITISLSGGDTFNLYVSGGGF